MGALQNIGFGSMHVYEEGHSKFFAPWSYLVSFKDSASRAKWYRNSAEIEIETHKRIHRTKSGRPALHYFDGPTMVSYQLPPKAHETMYCRSGDKEECKTFLGIDPETVDIPASNFEVRKSSVGEFAGRGLYAAQDISQGSKFNLKDSALSFHVLPSAWSTMWSLYEWADDNYDAFKFVCEELVGLITYIDGYGEGSTLMGGEHYTIGSGVDIFCNHGCNGTYNYEDSYYEFTEMNVDLDTAPQGMLNQILAVYSPVVERHARQILSIGDDISLRDIKKGEEILCNYLTYVGREEQWGEFVAR